MSRVMLFSRTWLPLCFAVLAALGLANLWQTSRAVAGTGPFSPPDSVEATDRRFESVRQSLLHRTAVGGDRGYNRGAREPVGYVAAGHSELRSPAWTELYYKIQYAMIPFVLDPAYDHCTWVLSVGPEAGALLTPRFQAVEQFASDITLWRRRAP